MKISFHGAARTVTGSKHLIEMHDGRKILLDCGMFQGMGRDTFRLNSEWGFVPAEIDYVIISHAHIDHSGLLPRLVRDGFKGPIFCTPPTADLIHILLADSAHIQQADTHFVNKRRKKDNRSEEVVPLYGPEDVEAVFPLIRTTVIGEHVAVDKDIELLYTDCGHIPGSAAINLTLVEAGKTTRLTFSGDVGRYNDAILRSPERFPQADFIVIESTYGDRLHDPITATADKLLDYITHTCLKKKGRLVIPAFSIGRTQDLLFMLNQLDLEHRLPPLNYYVDSPLSEKATDITRAHPECFNNHVRDLLKRDKDVFGFRGLRFIDDVKDSMALNDLEEPCVIISASGMAEAGRVKHHIAHAVADSRNTILMSGYCEPQSLGARLQEGRDEIGIFGRKYPLNAEVASITSLSAHGDYDDLCQWLACQNPAEVSRLFLVHGEYDVQIRFRERLLHKGFRDVYIPSLHEMVHLA